MEGIEDHLQAFADVRALDMPNAVPPALIFEPAMIDIDAPRERRRSDHGSPRASRKGRLRYSRPRDTELPTDENELAYLPVTHLAELIRSRKLGSEELTTLYLERLQRYDPLLHCVISLCERSALQQARRADREIGMGRYRGPLHGIPWGAKDLLSTKDAPTTWGAMPYKEQMIYEDATVVQRLDAAGAVLVAKLSLGALAWGDVWFGGKTRNPWDLEQGSSGSSASPSAARPLAASCLPAFAVASVD